MGVIIISPAIKQADSVMPDLIRHPVPAWIPAIRRAHGPEPVEGLSPE